MTQDDILKIAVQAGFTWEPIGNLAGPLERFAALVAAAERSTVKESLTAQDEPVATVERHGIVADVEWLPASWAIRNGDKLYTRPQPAQQPLTEEQIQMIDANTHFHESPDWPVRFARAIERAHGIGGAA
jgi:hypothetical protein